MAYLSKMFVFVLDFLMNYVTLMQGENVTHCLARHALSISDFVVWMETVPPLVFDVILADMANLV